MPLIVHWPEVFYRLIAKQSAQNKGKRFKILRIHIDSGYMIYDQKGSKQLRTHDYKDIYTANQLQ